MRISMNWIQDFVQLPVDQSPKDLSERLTLGTAEVEAVEVSGLYLSKVMVAEITAIEKHPQAEKLNLVSFCYGLDRTSGEKKIHRVVCGAPNVKVGLKVPYAPLDTELPGGFILKPKEIRGILSEGMLCSAEELQLEGDNQGLMILDDQFPVGTSLAEAFKIPGDIVLEVDNKSLTHRPDLWGHYGMAREFAALYGYINGDSGAGQSLWKKRFDQEWLAQVQNRFSLSDKESAGETSFKIHATEAEEGCSAFIAIHVAGVKVGPSPLWMRQRLESAGMRSVNNLVDISNYVMLELGHPMHFYDRKKIKGDILKIHSLKSPTLFKTLDGEDRQLLAGDLVISDEEKILVLAGIMGGESAEVDENTTDLLIEVANWLPSRVRKTSTRLGLRTESSSRFEKTLDSLQCQRVLYRSLELLLEVCPKIKVISPLLSDAQVSGHDVSLWRQPKINVRLNFLRARLGKMDLSSQIVHDILQRLEFSLKSSNVMSPDGRPEDVEFEILIPSFRATKDVKIAEDIVEELGRVIGFDHIAPMAPQVSISPVRLRPDQILHRGIRDFFLYHAQAFETMTYPLVSSQDLENIKWLSKSDINASSLWHMINALSEESAYMRPTLVSSHLKAVVLNQKHREQFRFFEIGRAYSKRAQTGNPSGLTFESNHLSAVYFHKKQSSFQDLVDDTETFFRALNLPAEIVIPQAKFPCSILPTQWEGLHPFEVLHIRLQGKIQGAIFSIHPFLLRQMKIRGEVSFLLLDLSAIEGRPLKSSLKYRPLSTAPSSSFDWTVVRKAEQSWDEMFSAIKKVRYEQLKSVVVVGEFPIPEGTDVAVTLRAEFHGGKETLRPEFLAEARENLMKVLEENHFPLKK